MMQGKETDPAAKVDISGRRLAHNTVLNLIERIVPLLVALAVMPYMVRRLSPDHFGLLALAWMVVSYLALSDLDIGPATTKSVAELLMAHAAILKAGGSQVER